MKNVVPSFLRTSLALKMLPNLGVGLTVGAFVAGYFGLGLVATVPIAAVSIVGASLTPYLAAKWIRFKEPLWVRLFLLGLLFGGATGQVVQRIMPGTATLPPAVIAFMFAVGIVGIFAWPLTLLADRETKALEGADRARAFVGVAIAVVSFLNSLQAWAGAWTPSRLITTVLGLSAFAVGVSLVLGGARRRTIRQSFLLDAEQGNLPEYVVVRDESRTTLVRVPPVDANYRVAPVREEILQINETGDVSEIGRVEQS